MKILITLFLFSMTYAGELKVTIRPDTLRTREGRIHLSLYRQGNQSFPLDYARADEIGSFSPKNTLSFTFKNLESDFYAVSLYHDEDNNEQMRLNFLGFPLEPFAFTRNPRPKLGLPSFHRCQIYIYDDQTTETHLLLRHL